MLFPLCPAPKAIEFCFSLPFYMNQNEKNHFLKMVSILINQEKSWKAVHLCSGHLISVSSPQKSYKTQFLREGFLLKMMIWAKMPSYNWTLRACIGDEFLLIAQRYCMEKVVWKDWFEMQFPPSKDWSSLLLWKFNSIEIDLLHKVCVLFLNAMYAVHIMNSLNPSIFCRWK